MTTVEADFDEPDLDRRRGRGRGDGERYRAAVPVRLRGGTYGLKRTICGSWSLFWALNSALMWTLS
ncbi:hypothetical protein GCM10010245_73830 [Streptomyces spectabilis]|nr:hypothetical protein GCM10010245_73830 [Streptomyces spectabilis]